MSAGRLAVIRDGVELPEEQARALWRAFSEHMERSRGDLEGFARDHGFSDVRPEHRRGRAVLMIATLASLLPPPVGSPTSRVPRRPTLRGGRPGATRGGTAPLRAASKKR